MKTHLFIVGRKRDLTLLRALPPIRDDEVHLYFWNRQFVPDSAAMDQLRQHHRIRGEICFSDQIDTLNDIAVTGPCTNLVNRFTAALSDRLPSPSSNVQLEQLPLILSNIITQDMRPVAQFVGGLTNAIHTTRADVVHSFGPRNKRPFIPPRPDISALYCPEAFTASIARYVASALNRQHILHTHIADRLCLPVSIFRSLLIGGYKVVAIASRILRSSGTGRVPEPNVGLLVLIRAESEYYSAAPLIKSLDSDQDLSAAIVQDDLLRHPSAKRTLDRESIPYIPIHAHINLFRFLALAISIFFRRRRATKIWLEAARKMVPEAENRQITAYNQIGQICAVPEILVPIMHSCTFLALEVLVFMRQIEECMARYNAKGLLCLDMVDKWGEAAGHVGRQTGRATFTLQNASMGNLVLPKAISTDFFYATSNTIRQHLIALGADSSHVLASGSPAYEQFFEASGNKAGTCQCSRSSRLVKTIAITTQPFPDRMRLNEKLIAATLRTIPENTPAKVIIKIHPRETRASYEQIVRTIKSPAINIELWQEKSLQDLFNNADVLVSRSSTTLMTAQFAGVPSIAFLEDLDDSHWKSIDYMNSPSIIKAFSEEELGRQFSKLIFSLSAARERQKIREEMESFVRENMGSFKEGPTRGIIGHIKTVISSKKRLYVQER